VQLISLKLIAPVPGAMAVTCALALAGPTAAGSSTSSAPDAGASGATGPAVLYSRVAARDVLLDHSTSVAGVLQPASGLQSVELEERLAGRWQAVARGHAVAGTFVLRFRPRRLGSHALRIHVAGDGVTSQSRTSSLDVFHRVFASWYGPGGTTACGQALTAHTLGVANRTLPCGTRVTLRYRHRTLRVPVIDRGPYVAGRDYDLTYATKQALHASDLTEVWANH
jgi:peptidoglycan lytic transglycosylase